VHWVDRGGDITYHGPGQLVGYPLLRLTQPGWQGERIPQADYIGYIRGLEESLIWTLAQFGIVSAQRQGLTGVWVPADVFSKCRRCRPEMKGAPAKIASIGVKVDARGVSRHGFALNVSPDMSYWDGIIPCGLDGVAMVSMADLIQNPPSVQETAEVYTRVFNQYLAYQSFFGYKG
jgi:lipoate-protein ligase B